MDIRKKFAVIFVSLRSFFIRKLAKLYRKVVGFCVFLKFESYNLFFRWIFYFIAMCSSASFTIFQKSVLFFIEFTW